MTEITTDGLVDVRVVAETNTGQKGSKDFGFVKVLAHYDAEATGRYEARNESEGGDFWAIPSFKAFANSLFANRSDVRFGDFSNMGETTLLPTATISMALTLM
jgi:hypothetical protein